MKTIFRTFAFLTLTTIALCFAATAFAGTYMSPKGKFQVSYPANWKQIDYGTVDEFLGMHEAGGSVLDYDAVFADSNYIPFFMGVYGILTVDTTGPLSHTQIDSVLASMKKSFGEDVHYFPVADLNAHQKTNAPVYDSAKGVITVISDVMEGDQLIKKHAFIVKFYSTGIANFFFYAPDSLFQAALPLFEQIAGSVTTDNYHNATPNAEVKIADLDNRDIPKGDDTESKSGSKLPFYGGGLFAVLIIIIIKMRKKRQAQGTK